MSIGNYKVHIFLDDKMTCNQHMHGIPREGDTMRFSGEKCGKVTEVIWCMDEDDPVRDAQRINVRVESMKDDK